MLCCKTEICQREARNHLRKKWPGYDATLADCMNTLQDNERNMSSRIGAANAFGTIGVLGDLCFLVDIHDRENTAKELKAAITGAMLEILREKCRVPDRNTPGLLCPLSRAMDAGASPA